MDRRKFMGMVGGAAGMGAFSQASAESTVPQATGSSAGFGSTQATSSGEYFDRVITNEEEFREVFAEGDAGALEDGDRVFIANEGAPYRITEYPYVDNSDVHIVGDSADPLIKVADGANVGGFTVGTNRSIEDVTFEGISHDGAAQTQSMRGRGWGMWLDNISGVTVKSCSFTRTAPYHEHNRNNSGVMLTERAHNYRILNNDFESIGDKSIQTNGQFGEIAGNFARNGFDRMIAASDAQGLQIHDNRLGGCCCGSMIGISAKDKFPRHISIRNNLAWGPHRSLFVIGRQVERLRNITFENNIGMKLPAHRQQDDGNWSGVRLNTGGVTIRNNHLEGYAGEGVNIRVQSNGSEPVSVTGNRITRCARAGTNRFNGINVESGKGLIALNVIAGQNYNANISGPSKSNFKLGLNYP